MSEPKDQRVPVMMSVSEVEAIDEWRAANKIWSRGEAIRQLVEKALDAEPKEPKVRALRRG